MRRGPFDSPSANHTPVQLVDSVAKMPKKPTSLTARGVDTLKTPGLHADGQGLYLQITPTGVKSWTFRYVSPNGPQKGKRRDMGLGPIKLLGLAAARDKVRELRGQVRDGIDPLEERKIQQTVQ